MAEKSPQDILMAGAKILAPVLEPHEFIFELETRGKGSAGWFASGSFRRSDRRLELHFRYFLGLVSYHIDQSSLDHETYMRFLGVYGTNQYPDFPQEPLESFHHLAKDIQDYCQDFICGDGQKFHTFGKQFSNSPMMFRGVS